jgi:hypothetical protein
MYDGGQPDLLSVSFLANEAVGGDGGALYLDTVCGASVTNATFVGNHADCGTISLDGACADGTGPNLFSNLALHGNVGATAGGVCIRNEGPLSLTWSAFSGDGVEFDGLESPVGVDGNVDLDPGFVSFGPALDPSTWDLHLRADSLLRDIGDPSVTDADGSRADIGGFAGAFAAYDWYDDVDVDGLFDGWESAHGLDPTVNDADADGDADGLDNRGELDAGTDPWLADTDGDGRSDGLEVLDGTDPLDPAG